MPFISISDDLKKKSFTLIENKFITKYMPILEPMAVKVYLFALYLAQNGNTSYTLCDLAKSIEISEEEAQNYFEYLEEFELVSVVSLSPFEVKILDADNYYSTPKKFKPEKYSDFTKSVQNILKGRMISTNEFREYFYLLEDCGFEQDALLMIINYCVDLRGDNIRFAYIKKVVKGFSEDRVTTAAQVNDKLSSYKSSTPVLIKLFSAAGIKKQPDVDDDKLYSKWTKEFGFLDEAIIFAAKLFKCKSSEGLDRVLEELFKNKKFDSKEIDDYYKNKNSLFDLAKEIGKNLGVYIQNAVTYVENYISPWTNLGYSNAGLNKIANYLFRQGKNSFEDMNDYVRSLFNDGIIANEIIDEYFAEKLVEDNLIKSVLTQLGLNRKIIASDRECLKRWKNWNFGDDMLLEAAKISAGKSNPIGYMNGVLSSWKKDSIFTPNKISHTSPENTANSSSAYSKITVERHFYDLRNRAELVAEENLKKATSDSVYGEIHNKLNDLNIQLAFCRDDGKAKELETEIDKLNKSAESRLALLGMTKNDFEPQYSCKHCNDTGYTPDGKPCKCMIDFIKSLS